MLKKIAVVALCTVGAVSASALTYAAVTSGPEGVRDFFRTGCHSSYSGHMGYTGNRMYRSYNVGQAPEWMMQEGIR